jgi:anthranilate phosphoribosyltransferase
VRIDLSPTRTALAIDTIGFGFLFAPQYHPALAKVAQLRRALEVRTVFNVLGPLANPARVRRQRRMG